MAEAAVEDRPPQKFYCHMCEIHFENASTNFTCPQCSNGFIEELQTNRTDASNNQDIDLDDWEDDDINFRDLFMGPSSHSTPTPNDERRSGRPRRHSDGSRSGRRYANTRARIVRPRTLTRLASTNLRQNNVSFENLIQDFIINLGVGLNWGPPGNMQFLLGNPGDYAWGREGLDAIVTQLLNQMDTTGPPPVSKDVIDALPIVEVTQLQVDSNLQCSICWENFIVNENVRQLPCLHIYHEPCIRPWLEIHGTCPICRQILINAGEQRNNENGDPDSGGPSNGGGVNTFNLIRNLFQPAQTSSSNNSNNNSTNSMDHTRSTRSRPSSDSFI